jgi:hypothetical protein
VFFFFQFIGAVMDESNGGKEEEIVIHKVDIRLSKGPMVEELSNVDEKPADGQPKVDVVAPEVVVVAPKVDFRIEFTTDMKFEQRNHMLSWIHGLAEKLGFVAVISKSDNRGNGCNTQNFRNSYLISFDVFI